MSPRFLIVIGVFLLAQVLMTFSRVAFHRAVEAANSTLPGDEAITRNPIATSTGIAVFC